MNLNKICPECETEYLPHIEKCADCGVVLLSPEEYRIAQDEKKRLMDKAVENAVMVRKGDLKWMTELYGVLIDSGIPCTVDSGCGCQKEHCEDECMLMVSSEDLDRAQQRIEEYFMEIHPEIRASNELIKQGKCPACGSPVNADAAECPDCGLPFVIIGEDVSDSADSGIEF